MRAAALLASLLPYLLLAVAPAAQAASRPNLLLAIADDLDPGQLGFLGNPRARTPRLDQLAHEGWFAPTLYSQPICRAALGVLLTGRWPHQTGLTSNGVEVTLAPEGVLPARLRTCGYATYCAGKFWEGAPPTFGFDAPAENDEEFARDRSAFETGAEQADLFRFLDERAAQGPWFVWWAPKLPHEPHEPPASLAKDFAETSLPLPKEFSGKPEDFLSSERASLAMHAWLDVEFARLLDKLAQLGELESTVILFVADNGWSAWRWSKGTPREQGVCLPLIVSAPGATVGGPNERLVDLVDVHATILDYAGLAADPTSPGQSLRPALEGKPSTARERLFGSASVRRGGVYALYARDLRWKYVLYVRDAKPQELSPGPWLAPPFRRKAGTEELFDLEHDPFERTNLAKDEEHAARLAELRAATLEWWRASGGAELPNRAR